MSWPNLEARFMRWFADALSRGDLDLAARLARIVIIVSHADPWAPPSLRLLFDEFEAAQAHPDTAGADVPSLPALRRLVDEIEDLLDDASGASSNGEPAVRYVLAARPRRSPAAARTGPHHALEPARHGGEGGSQNA